MPDSKDRIVFTFKKKIIGRPSVVQIRMDGKILLDGQLYNENKAELYKGVYISAEKHRTINMGEDTQKMIDAYKTAAKGETVVITDVETPTRIQKTTVKF